MRTIKKLHQAEFSPIADLLTYSPLPRPNLQQIDPFIFLNHHGPQVYTPDNDGLPFGPHPHRGMETVTFIIDGDIMHKDSSGHQSVITAGGIQWMTAGSGLIHAEVSSDEFKRMGGKLEILQLWLNLPAALKMTQPFYMGLQKDQIPHIHTDNERVIIKAISGNWEGIEGAFKSVSGVALSLISFEPGGNISISVPEDNNVFFYVVRGMVKVNDAEARATQLVEFNLEGGIVSIETQQESIVLFGHATPFNEPLVAQGPFVMNTIEEIREAYQDYRDGKFGEWNF